MRPHPRIRKTIKWGGAAVTLLLVVVWMVSGWWSAAWASDGGRGVAVATGYVVFFHTPPIPHRNFYLVPIPSNAPYRWAWLPILKANTQKWQLYLPLWPAILLATPITFAAWRLDGLARRQARARLNLCPKCGYDRAGLVGGAAGAKCPECGASPAS
jgi:hypothetical protein